MAAPQLIEFPNEILIRIFRSTNDTTLSSLRLVCKRFKEIAEEAVTQKYDGSTDDKWYEIHEYSHNLYERIHHRKQHRQFILNRV